MAVFDREITRREIRVPEAPVLALEYFYSRDDFETYKFTLPMNDEGNSCRGNKLKEDR